MTWMGPAARQNGRVLVVLLAATVLLPGVLLVVLGVRTLRQELRLEDQQLRERIEHAADVAVDHLDRQVRVWQASLEALPQQGVDIAMLPSELRSALATPGRGVVLDADGGAWPADQLLYDPGVEGAARLDSRTDPLIEAGERAEFQRHDLPGALIFYRRAARVPASAPPALAGVARVARKLGQTDRALAAYGRLSTTGGRVGALPSDLVARHEICAMLAASSPDEARIRALGLYRDLVAGRWRLDRIRFDYYAGSTRSLLGPDPPPEAQRWLEVERDKRALTDAAAEYRSAGAGRARHLSRRFLVLRGASSSVAVVVDAAWLAEHSWPHVFDAAAAVGIGVTLTGPSGDALFASQPAGGSAPSDLIVARAPEATQVVSRLTAFPLDPAAFRGDTDRRVRVYVVMLVLLMGLLTSGTLLVVRTVRREMEVARLQSDFVSTVSHEFRSPLTGIRQLSELLARGRVPSERRRQEYYERITRESDRLTRLVEHVLDASQIQDGRKAYRFAPIDTGPWLQSVVDEARTHHAPDGPTIVAQIPDGLPPVTGDPEALGSAVHNLLDNAAKYSPGREAVWLDVDAKDGLLAIRVRDTGIGIEEQERARIFERFYRGRGTITTQVKGAGLGLSLVAHIVQAHGGSVECESRPGEGSTFTIRLHASAGAAA